MTNITHYLLQVAVEAPARQTVTVRLEDLNLPAQVIDSLAEINSTPVRAPMSRMLQSELNALRLKQRAIYDECTIQSCGLHFLVSSYFNHYEDLKRDLVSEVQAANLRLEAEWENEYKAWSGFVDELLRPCLGTSPYFDDACQAYRGFFPTRKEFKNLIRVSVMGPLLVDLTPVAKPVDSDLSARIAYENMTNTSALLAQAKGIAEDKADACLPGTWRQCCLCQFICSPRNKQQHSYEVLRRFQHPQTFPNVLEQGESLVATGMPKENQAGLVHFFRSKHEVLQSCI